jgi:hypothetical protein
MASVEKTPNIHALFQAFLPQKAHQTCAMRSIYSR